MSRVRVGEGTVNGKWIICKRCHGEGKLLVEQPTAKQMKQNPHVKLLEDMYSVPCEDCKATGKCLVPAPLGFMEEHAADGALRPIEDMLDSIFKSILGYIDEWTCSEDIEGSALHYAGRLKHELDQYDLWNRELRGAKKEQAYAVTINTTQVEIRSCNGIKTVERKYYYEPGKNNPTVLGV